jgi:hypothetical protein
MNEERATLRRGLVPGRMTGEGAASNTIMD